MSHTRQFPLPTLYPSSLQLLLSPPPSLSLSFFRNNAPASAVVLYHAHRPHSPAVWLRVVMLDCRCCATAGTTGGSTLTKAPTGVLSGGFDPQRRLYRTKIPMNRTVRGVACIWAPPSPFPPVLTCLRTEVAHPGRGLTRCVVHLLGSLCSCPETSDHGDWKRPVSVQAQADHGRAECTG